MSQGADRILPSLNGMPTAMVKALKEHFEKAGIMLDEEVQNPQIASREKETRESHYHNVKSLLKRYRRLRRRLSVMREEFFQQAMHDMGEMDETEMQQPTGIFEAICNKVEIFAGTSEKKFKQTYAPHIAAGRRVEQAVRTIDACLTVLRVESPMYYEYIKAAYIDGENDPTQKEVRARLGAKCTQSYYYTLEKAERVMSRIMFGYTSNKNELIALLVFFQQQDMDPLFPNNKKHMDTLSSDTEK